MLSESDVLLGSSHWWNAAVRVAKMWQQHLSRVASERG